MAKYTPTTPTIQVLSKQNYEDQHLVALPNALPLPPLTPYSLRICTIILSLTTNNFTYARCGHLLGWWDVHPLPPSIPAEFANPQDYGRVSAWGYGVVVESTVPKGLGIEVGTHVYGYLPIGTLPVDMHVEISADANGQFVEISPQREKLMPVYNRYLFYSSETTAQQKAERKQSEGYDSLLQVLFEAGYMMNRFVFAWDSSELVHPSGADSGWTTEDARIGEDTILLLFAASGKTALAFAHQLKYGRPAGKSPRKVVGVGSDAPRAFTEGTGLYNSVLTYDADDDHDIGVEVGADADSKVVVVDFGARGGAADRWAEKLRKSSKSVTLLGVGGEVAAESQEVTTQKMVKRMAAGRMQVNTSGMRSQAVGILGHKTYFEELLTEWRTYRERGVPKGLQLVWGKGMDDVGKGWERLYKGKVGPDEGLVFELDNIYSSPEPKL
ncbi:hypothetical protein V498_04903 [Pseudogymnoascus sp. VKM F-4517 (FW-2822)]|nr:hypothetical protein V498_04903 [Pseudogymnoascus sp. VKM F-4517 (FW-2822)]